MKDSEHKHQENSKVPKRKSSLDNLKQKLCQMKKVTNDGVFKIDKFQCIEQGNSKLSKDKENQQTNNQQELNLSDDSLQELQTKKDQAQFDYRFQEFDSNYDYSDFNYQKQIKSNLNMQCFLQSYTSNECIICHPLQPLKRDSITYLPQSNDTHLFKLMRQNLRKKYLTSEDYYNVKVVNDIIYNEETHIVSVFKDYLIQDDLSEFLRRTYSYEEAKNRIPKVAEYYSRFSKIFPSYIVLPENRYMYKNIKKKQRIIDEQLNFIEKQKERKEQKEKLKKGQENKFNFTSMAEEDQIPSLLKSNEKLFDRKFMESFNQIQILEQQQSMHQSFLQQSNLLQEKNGNFRKISQNNFERLVSEFSRKENFNQELEISSQIQFTGESLNDQEEVQNFVQSINQRQQQKKEEFLQMLHSKLAHKKQSQDQKSNPYSKPLVLLDNSKQIQRPQNPVCQYNENIIQQKQSPQKLKKIQLLYGPNKEVVQIYPTIQTLQQKPPQHRQQASEPNANKLVNLNKDYQIKQRKISLGHLTSRDTHLQSHNFKPIEIQDIEQTLNPNQKVRHLNLVSITSNKQQQGSSSLPKHTVKLKVQPQNINNNEGKFGQIFVNSNLSTRYQSPLQSTVTLKLTQLKEIQAPFTRAPTVENKPAKQITTLIKHPNQRQDSKNEKKLTELFSQDTQTQSKQKQLNNLQLQTLVNLRISNQQQIGADDKAFQNDSELFKTVSQDRKAHIGKIGNSRNYLDRQIVPGQAKQSRGSNPRQKQSYKQIREQKIISQQQNFVDLTNPFNSQPQNSLIKNMNNARTTNNSPIKIRQGLLQELQQNQSQNFLNNNLSKLKLKKQTGSLAKRIKIVNRERTLSKQSFSSRQKSQESIKSQNQFPKDAKLQKIFKASYANSNSRSSKGNNQVLQHLNTNLEKPPVPKFSIPLSHRQQVIQQEQKIKSHFTTTQNICQTNPNSARSQSKKKIKNNI